MSVAMNIVRLFMDMRMGSSRRRKATASPSALQDSTSSSFSVRCGKRSRAIKEIATCATQDESGDAESLNSCSGSASVSAPWRADRIFVTGPPAEDDWWYNVGSNAVEEDNEGLEVSIADDGAKQFHNCGLETWERARAVWKSGVKRHDSTPPPLPRSNSKELVRGLTRARSLRSYELPRRTNLKDVVDTYVTIWNGMDEL